MTMKTVKLSARELELLIDALGAHSAALRDSLNASGNPELADEMSEADDLAMDLWELQNRDDGWDNDAIPCAAAAMIDAGIDAREMKKATSHAATRREERLLANDPIDW